MKEESTGVSPVIATILLIAITVVAVGVVMAFVAGLGRPTTPVSVMLGNTTGFVDNNSDNAYIYHLSGDALTAPKNNVSVTLNGNAISNVSFTDADGDGNFEVGDRISIQFPSAIHTGDVIMVIYKPTSQTLLTITVP
jgi:flagellin-like protein